MTRTVFFIRDRIESECKRTSPSARQAIFQRHTLIARNNLTNLLTMANDPRMHIVKFEDLILDPVQTVSNIFDFMGLKIDEQFYDEWLKREGHYINSSWKDKNSEVNNRWTTWTLEERLYFKSMTKDLLIDFGYEKDDTWIV